MTKERQKMPIERSDTPDGSTERNSRVPSEGGASVTGRRAPYEPGVEPLLEAVVERKNMLAAMHQVVRNKGAAGADGLTVDALKPHLQGHWPRIKAELLEGRYEPQPVRGVEIPKPGGKGVRKLGIPTVIDRMIQQALVQVLTPVFDPGFSESSFPGGDATDQGQP